MFFRRRRTLVILHTFVHHSSTSIYTPNFIKIKQTFCGQTYVCTYICMDKRTDRQLRPALLGRFCRTVDLITQNWHKIGLQKTQISLEPEDITENTKSWSVASTKIKPTGQVITQLIFTNNWKNPALTGVQ